MALVTDEDRKEVMDELEQSRVKAIFDKLDDDHDGLVTMAAIEAALVEAGLEMGGELGKRALAHCNPDERGLVTWPKFAKAAVVLGIKVRIGLFLRDQFVKMDTEKTGFVTHENLKRLIAESPAADMMTEEMTSNLFHKIDKENAGKVEFKLFLIGFFEAMKAKFEELNKRK